MKKMLLVFSVATALPAAAFAQTNVTLYGIADAGIGWVDSGGPGDSSTMVVNSGYQSASRFGLRGAEDLGAGLKATFNIEAGLNFDTGASESDTGGTFFGRRAVVGLLGGFGEVRLGRDYTPGFMAAMATDIFAYGLYGNWANYSVAAGGIETRASNGIHYTGSFGGVTVRAMYSEGETVSPANSGGRDMWGLSGVYAGGPLTIQAYYQEINNTAGDALKQMGVGGGYDFGAVRLLVNYGVADGDGTAVPHAFADRVQAIGLGGGIKLGGGELLAQIIRINGDSTVPGGDPKATSFGVGYVLPLSKRTNLYATYGTMRNNDTAAYTMYSAGNMVRAGDGSGSDPKGIAVGVRHRF